MFSSREGSFQDASGLVDFFLKNSSNWFWEANSDLVFTYSNGKFEQWMNLPADFLLGTSFRDLAEQQDNFHIVFKDIITGLEASPLPINLILNINKQDISGELTLQIDEGPTENGEKRYRGVATWKKVEIPISTLGDPLKTLFSAVENSPNGILITGTDGKIKYANPGFTKISGYSRAEVYGQTPKILQSGITDQLTYVRLWKDLKSGKSWEGTVLNKRKNGDLYWCEETISPVVKDNGDISHYIAIQHDVTDKVQAEWDLRQSEERFKGYSDAASDWYWEMDKNLAFSYFSDSVTLYSGLEIEEMLGDRRENLVRLPQDQKKWEKHHKDLLARKPFKDFDYTYIRPDGSVMIFLISGKPVFSDKGEFNGYRGVGRDITQRKQLEEQLRQSQKMEVVGQLAGGVAHDFNNILAIIQGNAELLIDKLEQSGAEVPHGLNNILFASDRGTALTNQILAFSRKQVLAPTTTNLNALIADIKDMLISSLSRGIDLVIHAEDNLWNSFIDSQQVTNAILNACVNARDAMKGSGKIEISTENVSINDNQYVTCVRPGDYVLLSITDEGEGVSPENLDKVFEPFFTTKAVGKGTGLGLSMLFGFAKQSGGGVSLESEIGVGTTLKLYLPRQIEPSS